MHFLAILFFELTWAVKLKMQWTQTFQEILAAPLLK